jgi:hypothetical protein
MTACTRPGDLEHRDLRGTITYLEEENARLRTEIERLSIDLAIRDGKIIAGQLVIPEHRAHLCRRSYLIGYADALDNQASIAPEGKKLAAQGPITYPFGSLGEEVQP